MKKYNTPSIVELEPDEEMNELNHALFQLMKNLEPKKEETADPFFVQGKTPKSISPMMQAILDEEAKEKGEHAKLANHANSGNQQTENPSEETVTREMPTVDNSGTKPPKPPTTTGIWENDDPHRYIPDSVYESLPMLLKDACKIFVDRNERDVFLTGALTVLGGIFVNLYGFNMVDKIRVAPNLMSFIIAPPASGKGALKYARKLANDVVKSYAELTRSTNSYGKLMIPADISASGLVEILQENAGSGIMIESEIDTLIKANKQDWGNYSDVLRNSFGNETCSLYRKKGSHLVEIENIKFSLAISGTIGQFKALMRSPENGLFSRGCYYIFQNEERKLKCFGRLNTDVNVDDQFAKLANLANSYFLKVYNREEVQVEFSRKQQEEIEANAQTEYDQIFDIINLRASVKRSFVITEKIATILTCLFACEGKELQKAIPCDDVALQMAMELGLVYTRHCYKAFELLPKENSKGLTVDQERLYALLPKDEFSRENAVTIAKQIGIPVRTCDKILKDLAVKGVFSKQRQGIYIKTK